MDSYRTPSSEVGKADLHRPDWLTMILLASGFFIGSMILVSVYLYQNGNATLFASSIMFTGFSLMFVSVIGIWNLHFWGVAVGILGFLVFYVRLYYVGTQIGFPGILVPFVYLAIYLWLKRQHKAAIGSGVADKNITDNKELNTFTLGLKITTAYLIVVGGIGLILPLLGFAPHHPEFEAQSTAYKAVAYFIVSIINIAFLASGIGILLRKNWGRTTGLIILAISVIYAGNVTWGHENGQPNITTLLLPYLVAAGWHGIWFYILFRKSTVASLN